MSLFKKFSGIGLAGRFAAWFLLISLVPMAIIGYLIFISSQNTLIQELNLELEALSFSRATHIEDLLKSTGDIVNGAAELDVFQDNLAHIVGEGATDSEEHLRELRESIEDINDKTNTFYRMKVIDKNGIVIVTTEGGTVFDEIGTDLSDRDYFIGASSVEISTIKHHPSVPAIGSALPTTSFPSPFVYDSNTLPSS